MTTALSLASLDSGEKEKKRSYIQPKYFPCRLNPILWTGTGFCELPLWELYVKERLFVFQPWKSFLSGLRSKALQRVGPPMESSTSCQRNFQPFTSSWSEKLWTHNSSKRIVSAALSVLFSWKLWLMSAVMSTEWWLMPETDSETQQHEALIKRTVGLVGVGLYEVLSWGPRQRQKNVF